MPSPDPSSCQTSRFPRVLLVEDDPSLRDVVSRYLQRRGYLVETAVDGIDGLKKLRQGPDDTASAFDLLITDLNMPNLDGIGLIRALRHYRLRLKIIACSSAFTQNSLNELKELSVDATLAKGSLADALVQVIEKVIQPEA